LFAKSIKWQICQKGFLCPSGIHECFGDKTLEFFTDFYKTHLEENELFFKKAEKISKIRKYMTDKVGIEDARFFVGDRNVRSNVNGEEK